MSTINIFVGPRKTGTSWLHHVVGGAQGQKEVRYPERFGRSFVYRKYVQDKKLLIWPYLLHEPGSLKSLLEDLSSHRVEAVLYVSERDHELLKDSMARFKLKYVQNSTSLTQDIDSQMDKVYQHIELLEANHNVTRVRIIEPRDSDLEILSEACGISIRALESQLNTKVYETTEVARIKSGLIVRLFFIIKPFLPNGLQSITHNSLLRQTFFKLKNKSK